MQTSLTPEPQDPGDHALRVTMLSLANAVLQCVAFALYAWEGDMPWPVLVAFVPLALGVPTVFALLIGLGVLARVKESSVLQAQAVVACAVQLGFLMAAPQLSLLFLVAIMITFNIFMLGTSPRQLTRAWLLLAVAAGSALWCVRGSFRYPDVNDLGLYALWLYFFLAVRQLTVLGVRCGNVKSLLLDRKQRLSQTVAALHEHAGDERVLERERIVRELHDTLLQGVQAMVLRIHAAHASIPRDEPASRMIGHNLARADEVIVAAREQLGALREESATHADVTAFVSACAEGLAQDFNVRFTFHPQGVGSRSHTAPEVLRLMRDLMINAFRHLGVQSVDVAIDHSPEGMTLRLRQDRGDFVPSQAERLRHDEDIASLEARARGLDTEVLVAHSRRGMEVTFQVRHRMPQRGAREARRGGGTEESFGTAA